ncbi:hypothetical protein CXG81DRAFT_16357 [Caulochytrium protostelioides]|uniref:Uncharacterized protein n=1 Tax=Caulochytrium protostelioides TaxID=1555241 RepID=A0A4P9XF85_9FUNG|nr:hypothetical protein CXG81DRAFT_16357 [Caulochytrium protostelioides]|eukprot:RKP04224.1 hypothetical protein CXG81DRAFT_16357 [Caulochytrium protostelioides]
MAGFGIFRPPAGAITTLSSLWSLRSTTTTTATAATAAAVSERTPAAAAAGETAAAVPRPADPSASAAAAAATPLSPSFPDEADEWILLTPDRSALLQAAGAPPLDALPARGRRPHPDRGRPRPAAAASGTAGTDADADDAEDEDASYDDLVLTSAPGTPRRPSLDAIDPVHVDGPHDHDPTNAANAHAAAANAHAAAATVTMAAAALAAAAAAAASGAAGTATGREASSADRTPARCPRSARHLSPGPFLLDTDVSDVETVRSELGSALSLPPSPDPRSPGGHGRAGLPPAAVTPERGASGVPTRAPSPERGAVAAAAAAAPAAPAAAATAAATAARGVGTQQFQWRREREPARGVRGPGRSAHGIPPHAVGGGASHHHQRMWQARCVRVGGTEARLRRR